MVNNITDNLQSAGGDLSWDGFLIALSELWTQRVNVERLPSQSELSSQDLDTQRIGVA